MKLMERKKSRQPSTRRRPRAPALRKLPDSIDKKQFKAPISVTYAPDVVGFPDRLTTILKYSETYTFTGVSPSAQVWALNSAFDPNNSGAGHQPSYYDVYSLVYGRYYVRQFMVTVDVSQTASVTYVDGVLAYADQSVAANTVEQITEAKYARPFRLSFASGAGANKRIRLPWMSQRQIMGQPIAEPDSNLYATVTSSPADICFGILKLTATDGVTSISCSARVYIYMEIVFKDLLTQYSSLLTPTELHETEDPTFEDESEDVAQIQPIPLLDNAKASPTSSVILDPKREDSRTSAIVKDSAQPSQKPVVSRLAAYQQKVLLGSKIRSQLT